MNKIDIQDEPPHCCGNLPLALNFTIVFSHFLSVYVVKWSLYLSILFMFIPEIRSGICIGCYILKMDRMCYAVSVSDFLSSSTCSVELDAALKQLPLKIASVCIYSAAEHQAASGMLLKRAAACLVGSQSLTRVVVNSSGGHVHAGKQLIHVW